MFLRITRLTVGILLLPVCYAASRSLVQLVKAIPTDSSSLIPPAAAAICGGFLVWLVMYFVLPTPVRTYVLAHELTHALWGTLMGARVSNIKVAKDKGSVTVSKTNFIITLAPYFFPLYTFIIIAAYLVLSIFYDVEPYFLWWLGLVGFTWGFHMTFTISSLLQHQSDIHECGYVFSYAVIYLFNVLGIALWVVMVSAATLEQFVLLCQDSLIVTAGAIWHLARQIWPRR
ncbi:MAG: hypothetical protein C0404_02570 [Verrucomicrobia bacterium]|nr:hypothetical protein [Verrucomicrobiota bacterium]